MNPRIGAVATPWSVIFTGAGFAEPLRDGLLSGKPAGKAVGEFNSSVQADGRTMCLIGDPYVRIRDAGRMHSSKALSNVSQTPPVTKSLANLLFLRALIWQEQRLSANIAESLACAALEAIDQYERAILFDGDTGCGMSGVGERMRQAILRYLSTCGSMPSQAWLRIGSKPQRCPDFDKSCTLCGTKQPPA